jgi:hypothetical protein
MLDVFHELHIFVKNNLKSDYQIRMKEKDEWKIALKTKYELY